jgi:hypothetical protein
VNIRRRAEKVLKAMSPAAYAATLGRLEGALADSHRRGADHLARAAMEEISLLKRAHPQPEPKRYLEAGVAAVERELDRRLTIPGPEPLGKSAFRRFGGKHKRGKR